MTRRVRRLPPHYSAAPARHTVGSLRVTQPRSSASGWRAAPRQPWNGIIGHRPRHADRDDRRQRARARGACARSRASCCSCRGTCSRHRTSGLRRMPLAHRWTRWPVGDRPARPARRTTTGVACDRKAPQPRLSHPSPYGSPPRRLVPAPPPASARQTSAGRCSLPGYHRRLAGVTVRRAASCPTPRVRRRRARFGHTARPAARRA